MALNLTSSTICYRTLPPAPLHHRPIISTSTTTLILAGDNQRREVMCCWDARRRPESGGALCETRVGGGGAAQARLGSSGGAGVLERPGLDQSQSGQEPKVEEGGEMGKLTQRRIFGGGERYRVLLLDHEKHTEGQVTAVLPKVVPSITAEEARKCFQISREMGVGIVTVTVKEHAEFYAQMMARCGLRSGIEPDSDTF